MQKKFLIIIWLFLLTSTNTIVYAQNTEKKESVKTTTADAWRQALPENEQSPDVQPAIEVEESKVNVEVEETAAQTEKTILDLERKLMEAVKGRDSVALKNLLADDFMLVGINIGGSQADKTSYIEWVLKSLELKSYDVEKTTVRVYPMTAVVTVYYKRQANIADVPSDGDFTATNVWIKREKLWQAVSHHISQLPKPPAETVTNKISAFGTSKFFQSEQRCQHLCLFNRLTFE